MATHSLYEILTRLVERVTWPTEAEKIEVLASIKEAHDTGALGVRVSEIACPHSNTTQISQHSYGRYFSVTKCTDCGKENV